MSPVSMIRSSRKSPLVKDFKSYSKFCHAISELSPTPQPSNSPTSSEPSLLRYWSKSMTFSLGIKREAYGLLRLSGEFTQFSPVTRRRFVDVQVFGQSVRVKFGSVMAIFSSGEWRYYSVLDSQSPYARSYSLFPLAENVFVSSSGVSEPKHLVHFLVAVESLCSSL